MKRFLAFFTAMLILSSMFAFPTSAKTHEILIDDTDFDLITYYNADGEEHTHELDIKDDSDDEIGGFSWFQGSHLYLSSGHFAYPGSYCVIKFTGVGFAYLTQYRGPVGSYSSSAAIYIDGELVANLSADILNASNDTTRTTLFEIHDLENTEHIVKIVNDTEEETGKQRLPFDLFKIWTVTEDVETTEEETTKADVTTVKADDASDNTTVADAVSEDTADGASDSEEKSSNVAVIIIAAVAGVIVIAVVVIIIVKKKKK